MSVPPAHKRILPHMEISEQGLRELEIWLLDRLKVLFGGGAIGILYNFLNVGPTAGSWIDIVTNSVGPGFHGFRLRVGVGIDDREGDADFEFGRDWNVEGGNDYNVIFQNDINMQPHNDWNLVAFNDVNEVGLRDWNALGQRSVSILHGYSNPSTTSTLVLGSRSALHPKETFTHTDLTLDLGGTAGNTYVINDHLGSPLVTYTG